MKKKILKSFILLISIFIIGLSTGESVSADYDKIPPPIEVEPYTAN